MWDPWNGILAHKSFPQIHFQEIEVALENIILVGYVILYDIFEVYDIL